jgi:hypothetical protein
VMATFFGLEWLGHTSLGHWASSGQGGNSNSNDGKHVDWFVVGGWVENESVILVL